MMPLIWLLIPLVAVFVLTALVARRMLVVVTVHGRSMEPAYHDGDRVLVRRTRKLVVGQVTVVEHPHDHNAWSDSRRPPLSGGEPVSSRKWLIKRVAATPGDPVPRDRVPRLADVPHGRVPLGKVVLLGDNTEVSYDSRSMGFIPVERILGVVVRQLDMTASATI
ncbi:S26 family signal peptidase [Streptosporangium sp. CA-135522]|uniref:S26 family signal peptidase n=1 Tax=Streptosporangium sp. CA-135522 TaxID=3240072 RepID=UPI003D8F77B4